MTDDHRPTGAGRAQARRLVFDDEHEAAVAELERRHLVRAGYDVRVETDPQRALAALAETSPAALVVDLTTPGLDGPALVAATRLSHPGLPVVFLTADAADPARLPAPTDGAFVRRPFSPRVLVDRVGAVLRPPHPGETGVYRAGAVTVDRGKRRALVDDREIALTATEFDLLVQLVRRPGRVLSRDQLLAAARRRGERAHRRRAHRAAARQARPGQPDPHGARRGLRRRRLTPPIPSITT